MSGTWCSKLRDSDSNRSVVHLNRMMLLRNNERFNHRQMETQTLQKFGNFPRRQNFSIITFYS